MSKFVILLNGGMAITARLRLQLENAAFVAADGGMVHAESLGVNPICWIGDFDSANKQLLSIWQNVPRQVHPSNKDVTDGVLAIKFALEHGASEIILVGAFGGRTDMVMCHLTQLIKLREKDVRCFATSGNQEAWPIVQGLTTLDLPEKTKLSLVGFETLKGVDISAVKWPLANVDIEFGDTIGLSNVVEGRVVVNVRSGCGVAIAHGLM